jgi:hypothetical protein
VNDPAACLWCNRPFEPHRGGSPQTFCGAVCRAAFHRAARQWSEKEIAEGRLSVEALRNGLQAAYTPLGFDEPAPPPSNLGASDPPGEAPLRLLVEVERGTIEAFVRFGWLREDQQDDLFAVIAALKRLGRAPSVFRVA